MHICIRLADDVCVCVKLFVFELAGRILEVKGTSVHICSGLQCANFQTAILTRNFALACRFPPAKLEHKEL